MAVTAASLKSFMMSQKAMQLALGLFVITNVFELVKTLNNALLSPFSSYFSRQLTEKINVGDITLGVGANIEAVVDGVLQFMVAMAFAHILMKVGKVQMKSVPVFTPFSL